MKYNYTLMFGDCRERLQELDSNSVELMITSPPYSSRKDYNHPDQIGFGQNHREYLSALLDVWKKCYDILHPGCKMCINVGDLYTQTKIFGRYKIISLQSEIIRQCEQIGFDLVNVIIWRKICRCHPSGGASIMGSYPHPRNGIVKEDFEYILIFKKLGAAPKVSAEIKHESKLSLDEWTTFFSGHWDLPGDKNDLHPATFPIEIPSRLIRMYSFIGETILDPFLGSGTTMLAAKMLKRNCIGIELNKVDYWPVIRDKTCFGQDILNESKFEVI